MPSDTEYRLGSGLRLPALGLTVGGYATMSYDKLERKPGRLSVSDFSLSMWWEGASRWKVFTEFNLENSLASRAARDDDEDRYLALERFYVDYAMSERTTLRAGKFLTPIGRWNLVHATPLVWTTSRPLATSIAFPTNVTGAMVSSSASAMGVPIDWSIYGSSGDEVRPNPSLDPFHEALGLRAVLNIRPGASIGVSYVSFDQVRQPDERRQLYGLDLLWSQHGFELSGEFVYRTRHAPLPDEGGGFVQVVAPMTTHVHAVVRAEMYRQATQATATTLWVFGLAYRPTPAIVLKAEWVNARHNAVGAAEGFLSSVSVLF